MSGVPTLGHRVTCVKSPLSAVSQAVLSVVLAGVLAQGATVAAVPVEDSLFRAAAELDIQTLNDRTSEVDEDQALWAPASQSTAATSALVGEQPLFYQMQVLQQEVRQLSGLVEEQARNIKKLQQDQRLQYIDLDRRVAALAPNRPARARRRYPKLTASQRWMLMSLDLSPRCQIQERQKPQCNRSRNPPRSVKPMLEQSAGCVANGSRNLLSHLRS